MERGTTAEAGPLWLRDFFPGYFAMVMGTGIVAVAARLLGRDLVAWPLFALSLAAYPLLWALLLARIVRFPRAVLADFMSHQRGPSFLTIVAANGVLGSQFAVFDTLTFLLPGLFWFSLLLWVVIVYGFLSAVTVGTAKPDLEHGLNGGWLLLVVATEAIAVLACFLASRTNAPPSLVFAALAYYLLGAIVCTALGSNPVPLGVPPDAPGRDGCALVDQYGCGGDCDPCRRAADGAAGHRSQSGAVATFRNAVHRTSVGYKHLLDSTSRHPVHLRKELQRSPHGYDPGLWSVVFPLGMYVAATHDYATEAHLSFLDAIPHAVFWVALLAWVLTFVGMWVQLLRPVYLQWFGKLMTR
jgi:tellurite resistance protein TehA-like permease